MQSVVFSVRRKVLESDCEVCHLEVLVVHERVFSVDENVVKTDIDYHPQTDQQVEGACHDGQTLPTDCASSWQVNVFFATLHRYYKVRLFFNHAFGIGLISGKHRELAILLPNTFVFEIRFNIWSHVTLA